MSSGAALRNRIRPGALVFLIALVGAATYFEFVYTQPSLYAVILWVICVPLLFSATVRGVRDHPLYQPIAYASFIAVGMLQYLDGEWFFLSGLFVLGGVGGLVFHLHNRNGPMPS